MRQSYEKPEITKETKLRRDLVYADAETDHPQSGCSTVVRIKIDRNSDKFQV